MRKTIAARGWVVAPAFAAVMASSLGTDANGAPAASPVEAAPQLPGPVVDPDGTVQAPAMALPFSSFASTEARRAFIEQIARIRQFGTGGSADIADIRAKTVAYMTPMLDRAKAAYLVTIDQQHIAGVAVDIVTPKDGVSGANRNRVLINLHNGGFFVGGGISGRVEGVPIAGLGKIKVVAVDYRQGPEFKFPAASEDVAAVYADLLKKYPARNIGIYGCSAGGLLVAEATAWLQAHGLPRPGAIGIFCASASGWAGGDSTYFTSPYSVVSIKPESPHFTVSDAAYFSEADIKDPLVEPAWSPGVLAKFPPTLVLTGTRDIAMSSAIYTHGQLVKQGVEADLHVWDGMGHAFFLDSTLPESREAYAVIVKFFEQHLGR